MQYGWRSLILKTLPLASSVSLCCLVPINLATAQITPDNTLGAESSVVTPQNTRLPGLVISGGAQRGMNLFHSFKDFSVPTNNTAYFNNAVEIQNIFSRVTGTSVSTIDGVLKANGTANLFLLNPNGIIFGPHASLAIGDSFLATTADAFVFNNGEFSATNPQAPPLLTVNIPIGLRFRDNPGSILNQSVGLQVQPGKSFALVGGNVTLDSSGLSAPGGRVELGGLSQAGTVGINSDGSLSFPPDVQRADVSLTGGSLVNVSAGGGGSIAVNAGNLNILTGSRLLAGIGAGLGSVGAVAGDITLNATGETKITGSYIFNYVQSGGVGKGGSINITTGLLSLTNAAELDVLTAGQGDAGNVNINALAVNFDGMGSNGQPSGAFNTVAPGGVGKGGDINITTGSLSLTNGAELNASTNGQGDTGSVTITARDTAPFDGVGSNGGSSGAFSQVAPGAVGKGGGVNITTGSLAVTNGAELDASTFGQGDAGSVNITAPDTATFDGVGSNRQSSGAFSTVGKGAVGQGGGLNITTGSLSLTNGAELNTSTFGQGDAGSVTITARDTATFDGVGSNGGSSGAGSQVAQGAVGKGGGLNITTGSLAVTNGAELDASTLGQGDAGSVNITVRNTTTFDGVGSNGKSSSAGSDVNPGAVGKGGRVNITTGSLAVTNGAVLGASTLGQGDAGSVNITVRNTATFDGVGSNGQSSGTFSTVEKGAVGQGGGVNITTGALSVTNGAELNASTNGQGDAGSVTITAKGTVTFDGVGSNGGSSGAGSTVGKGAVGQGGGVNITTGSLAMTNGAELNASTNGQGDAGSVTITAKDTVTFDGVGSNGGSSGAGSVVGKGAVGKGGDIQIQGRSLSLTNGAVLSSTSAGNGAAGSIEVSTAKDILLDNGSSITSNTTGGQGNINLRSRDLFLRHNSDITTNATGTATGGNITIYTGNLVAVPLENSDISANAQDSFGGRISITAAGIFGTLYRPHLTPLSDITATSNLGPQFNGTVQLNILSPDPSRGLAELPQNVVDPASQIANNPCTKGKSSEFTITGRGGLPPNPNEALNSDAVSVGLVDAAASNQGNRRDTAPVPASKSTIQKQIVPAQGWVYNEKGQVILTAYNPAVTQPQRPWQNPGACHPSSLSVLGR